MGLNIGGEYTDWKSAKVLVLIIVGIALSGVFFFVETKVAKYPVMPVQVFKNRSNAAAIAIGAFHAFVSHNPFTLLIVCSPLLTHPPR